MLRKIHSLTAVAALALTGSAFAADDQNRGMPGIDVDTNAKVSMSNVDKNSDGKVTKAEASSDQQLSQKFDSLDANKDGNLDKGEFAKFEAKGSAGNKDGAPGRDEGEPANTTNRPGTTDDSTPGNPDKLGPGR